MIRSMTGYGRGTAEAPGFRITVELRSLNNRFADLKLKLPAELLPHESEIRRRVLARIRRGRLEMSLSLVRSEETEGPIVLNRPLVKAMAAAARTMREEFGLTGEIDVSTALSMPDILQWTESGSDLGETDREAVRRAVDAALDALEVERCREGAALRDEILGRIARMKGLVGEIRGLAEELPRSLQRKLVERIGALAASVAIDPGRVAQEVALLADRCDVTEELVRLEGHIQHGRTLLRDPDGEPVGKRLEFLLQEIHRETNTINSKAADLEVSRRALALKSEAEKVREQIQNLE